MNDLDQILGAYRYRLRILDSWLTAQRGLWIPTTAMLLIQIVGRLIPIPGISIWSGLPILVWFAAVIIYTVFKPTSLMQTALRLDASLGLKERLSSAIALKDIAGVPQIFRLRLRADALYHVSGLRPPQAFPFIWLRRPIAIAGVIFSLSILSIWLPNPMDSRLQEQAAFKQAILAEAEKMATIRQQLESGDSSEHLTPAQREELLRQLDDLERALKSNPGDLEQALADLDRFEEQLRQNLDPNIGIKQAYLETLTSQLSSLSEKKTVADLSDPASAALQDLLAELDQMDSRQRQEATQRLAQMATQASQAGEISLSQALASLAQAFQNGNPQAIETAAQTSQAALQQINQQLSIQQTIEGMLNQAQSSQQALAQVGRQAAQFQGQTRPGSNQPAGPGGGSGQPSGSGGGSQANQLPPSTGGRTNVHPRGSASAAQTGAFDDQVFAPWQRSAANGEQLFIPGQDTDQGQTSTTEGQSSQAGLANPALMPYSQVFFQYLNTANLAMQQNYIPTNLQEYVRLYFSSLEPK